MVKNKVYGNSALTGISGSVTTYTSSAFTANIGGKAYTIAGVSGGATPTVDGNTGLANTLTANHGLVMVWAVNSSGTLKTFASLVQALDASGNFLVYPDFTRVPDSYVPFAYSVHKGGSTLSGTFTFGSSNWNTSGMTHAVVPIAEFPSRPQVS